MGKQNKSNDIIRLHQGELQPDGLHSSNHYSHALRMGHLLRVRPGLYVEAEKWFTAPPWLRYDIALAAAASPAAAPIFCRQAALRLHGIPLLNTPKTVTIRTTQRGQTGIHRIRPLSGSVPAEEFIAQYRSSVAEPGEIALSDLQNVPAQLIEAALPVGYSRESLRELISRGDCSLPQVRLPADALSPVMGSAEYYLAEPLELALVDTASRLPFLDAVVLLDAARNRDLADIQPWLRYLRSKRLMRNWQLAWEFADARSESPLESTSRALIHQLGFKTPTPQVTISTDEGTFRVDLAWLGEGIVGEVDGRMKYYDDAALNSRDPRDVAYAEKRRRDALDRRGWTVVRWGYRELQAPELLHRRLQQASVPRRV